MPKKQTGDHRNSSQQENNNDISADILFNDLALAPQVLNTLKELGYESPTPIQTAIIPLVMQGRDVIGQAQTGTGKTAAFALPLISQIEPHSPKPQVLVLTPTRELAIQVATAFESYADGIDGVNVMPIYGGQSYEVQLKKLRKGVQVIVGTPGRVMDHLRRKTLTLDNLTTLVLDEADEMLRMGFIDDVEWILEKTPSARQVALFSATMPEEIKRIANKYLNNPEHVAIKSKTSTASTISQSYWMLKSSQKMNSLFRILSYDFAENSDNNAIVFVRTKMATIEVVDFLASKGFASEALNGDVPQNTREKIIDRARKGKVKVLVATDVAARGLDIDNISHVINFDIPFDVETYVHRIGRTGRAGRSGEAILFITPKEQRLLRSIERTTRQTIQKYNMPSLEEINQKRVESLLADIEAQIEKGVDKQMYSIVKSNALFQSENKTEVMAALLQMVQQQSLFLDDEDMQAGYDFAGSEDDSRPRRGRGGDSRDGGRGGRRGGDTAEEGMERYRIEVGRNDNVMPKNIVGAIANEIGLDAKHIGQIKLFDHFSTVDLPEGMPKDVLAHLKKVRVGTKPMNISLDTGRPESGGGHGFDKGQSKGPGKGRGNPGKDFKGDFKGGRGKGGQARQGKDNNFRDSDFKGGKGRKSGGKKRGS